MRLLVLLLMIVNLFGSEFVFNKEFSKEVSTNILQMSLTVSTTSKKDEKDVWLFVLRLKICPHNQLRDKSSSNHLYTTKYEYIAYKK